MTEGAPKFCWAPSIPGMRADLLLNWKLCPFGAPWFTTLAAFASKKSTWPYCPGAGAGVWRRKPPRVPQNAAALLRPSRVQAGACQAPASENPAATIPTAAPELAVRTDANRGARGERLRPTARSAHGTRCPAFGGAPVSGGGAWGVTPSPR